MSSRIVTGIIIGIVGIGSAVWMPGILGFAVLTAAVSLAALEIMKMGPAAENRPLVYSVVGLCTAAMLVSLAGAYTLPLWILLFALGSTLPMLILLFQRQHHQAAYAQAAAASFSFLYVGGLGSIAASLTQDPHFAAGALLSLIATSWASDTTAYFGGRFFGRSKLYESVSPKKTWAGAWFGLAGAVAGVAIVRALFDSPLPWPAVIMMGLLGGLMEQLGDLCESMLKRAAGVKDSGALLPGHGGLLDRIDGMLYAAPVVAGFYWFAWIWY